MGPAGVVLLRGAPAVGALVMAAVLARWALEHRVGQKLLLAVGIYMIRHDSATYRPGSAIHFERPSATDSGGGGVPPPRRSPLEVFPNYECSWTSRRAGSG